MEKPGKEYKNTQKNIKEIKRILDNIPARLRNNLSPYADMLIKLGQFNFVNN